MREAIVRYPVNTVSKGMKQRVELHRYLGYRRLRCHYAQRSMVVCLHSRLKQFRRYFDKKKTPTKDNFTNRPNHSSPVFSLSRNAKHASSHFYVIDHAFNTARAQCQSSNNWVHKDFRVPFFHDSNSSCRKKITQPHPQQTTRESFHLNAWVHRKLNSKGAPFSKRTNRTFEHGLNLRFFTVFVIFQIWRGKYYLSRKPSSQA